MLIETEITEYELSRLKSFRNKLHDNDEDPLIIGILNRMIYSGESNNALEREKRIYDMKTYKGYTFAAIGKKFGISAPRAAQIYHRYERKQALLNNEKKYGIPTFYSCLLESAEEIGMSERTVTRTYYALRNAGIIQELEELNITLDKYSNEYLLSIRNFGRRCLELSRDANERYKKIKIRNQNEK